LMTVERGGSGRIYTWPTLTSLPVDTREKRWSTLITVSVDSKSATHTESTDHDAFNRRNTSAVSDARDARRAWMGRDV